MEIGRFDPNLQMFVETSKPINRDRLRFMRWLADKGRLEHPVAGPPEGDHVMAMVARFGRDSIMKEYRQRPVSQYEQTIK